MTMVIGSKSLSRYAMKCTNSSPAQAPKKGGVSLFAWVFWRLGRTFASSSSSDWSLMFQRRVPLFFLTTYALVWNSCFATRGLRAGATHLQVPYTVQTLRAN